MPATATDWDAVSTLAAAPQPPAGKPSWDEVSGPAAPKAEPPQEFERLFQGVDRLKGPEWDALDRISDKPKEARARAINQGYWGTQGIPATNWPAARLAIAKAKYGYVGDDITDEKLYQFRQQEIQKQSVEAEPSYQQQWQQAVKDGSWQEALRVYGRYFSSPWKRYEQSVEQSFDEPAVRIPQVSMPKGLPVGLQEAGEVGAKLANVAGGLVSSATSSGGVSMLTVPGTMAYAVPFFAAKTWDAAKQAGEDFIGALRGKPTTAGQLAGDELNLFINALGAFAGTKTLAGMSGIEAIKSAAIKDDAGQVHEGLHHRDVAAEGKEGFTTTAGRFVDRKQGMAIAKAAGQVDPDTPGGELHSEHVVPPGDTAVLKPGDAKAEEAEPVDIGKRDESVSTGTGKPTAKEKVMLEQQQAEIDEWKASKPNPPSDYGIAARVSEMRAKQGKIEPVIPGEGMSWEESVAEGRELLKSGKNPFATLQAFTETGKLSSEDMALVRAHGEQLAKAANLAADQHGLDSPEYTAAAKADSDWIQAIKPMQTEWHRIGEAQQGEAEIDTGSFHGLRRSYQQATGEDFNLEQAKAAKEIAGKVRTATNEAESASQLVFDFLKEMPPDFKDLPAQVKAVWNLAKKYADEGESNFDDMRHKIAQDLGLSVDEVTKNLAEPKSLRRMTDEMYKKLSKRRDVVQDAKTWLRNEANPEWIKFARSVPGFFFRLATLGHGTVISITHGAINVFDPMVAGTWWTNFFRAFRMMGLTDDGAYHERTMQDMVRDPNWTPARRAGLQNDPRRYTEDYQSAWSQTWFKKLGLLGNRGYDAIKLTRQGWFNKEWNALPESERTPDEAKLLADGTNHATGVIRQRFREWSQWTFFAPRLEGSRWAWMFADPAKAAKTFSKLRLKDGQWDWGSATPAEQHFALRELKHKAAITGTYLGLLAMNQGLLSAVGAEQSINFTDPKKADFLAFKVAGHKVGVISPMIGMVRLFANLLHASLGTRTQFEKAEGGRGEEMARDAYEYGRTKLSPFTGLMADLLTQADFQQRPLPFSEDKVPARLRREGVGPYTYGEYMSEKLTPIPVSEAVREVWRQQGMNETQIDHWLWALTDAAIMGTSGVRVSPDTSKPAATTGRTLTFPNKSPYDR
jgi:hypothetical protein